MVPVALVVYFLTGAAEAGRLDHAHLSYEAGNYPQAQSVLEELLREEDDAEAHVLLARTYLELGQWSGALDQAQAAVSLEPDRAEYAYWLGRAYGEKVRHSFFLTQLSSAPKVREAFERAVALDPAHARARSALGEYYVEAPEFLGGGIERAREQAEALMALDEVRGRLLWARIHEKERHLARAEREYRILEQFHGDHPRAPEIFEQYGRFLMGLNRQSEALRHFQTQARLEPNDADAHRNIGTAHRALGNLREARTAYERAVELDPRDTEARSAVREIEKDLRRSGGR